MCWGHTQWLHCFNGLCNHFQRGFPILYQQRRNFGTTSVLHCLIHRPQTLLEKPVNGLLVFQERSYLLWVCALEPTWNIPVVCMLVFSFVLFLFSSISCFISPHLMGIKWIISLGLCVTETKRGWDDKIVFCVVLCSLPIFLLKRAHEF